MTLQLFILDVQSSRKNKSDINVKIRKKEEKEHELKCMLFLDISNFFRKSFVHSNKLVSQFLRGLHTTQKFQSIFFGQVYKKNSILRYFKKGKNRISMYELPFVLRLNIYIYINLLAHFAIRVIIYSFIVVQ